MSYKLKLYKQTLARLEKKQKELQYYLFEFKYNPFDKFVRLAELSKQQDEGLCGEEVLKILDEIKAKDEKDKATYDKYHGEKFPKWIEKLLNMEHELGCINAEIYYEQRREELRNGTNT